VPVTVSVLLAVSSDASQRSPHRKHDLMKELADCRQAPFTRAPRDPAGILAVPKKAIAKVSAKFQRIKRLKLSQVALFHTGSWISVKARRYRIFQSCYGFLCWWWESFPFSVIFPLIFSSCPHRRIRFWASEIWEHGKDCASYCSYNVCHHGNARCAGMLAYSA